MQRGVLALAALLGITSIGAMLPAQSQDREAAERQKLAGTWQGFVVNGRGERVDRGIAKLTEVVITPTSIRAKDDTVSFGEGTYRLDLTQTPPRLDPTGTAGQVKDREFTGIYTLEGDTLKWCVANPGRARPTEFKTTAAVQFYMVLKRVPKA
ncbi:MAG: hypothetical protein K0Q72_2294 [Armatimonadetes bacterium]|nr:hypothetical protein [Armatimonadota bacterium]